MSLNMIQVFKFKNFQYYFTGKSVSLIGNWLQRTALSWYIYTLTDSVFWLGLVGFISQIPAFITTPLGGFFADKYSRLRLMQWCQFWVLVQAMVLAVLVLSKEYEFISLSTSTEIWSIVFLSFFLGCVESFESPIRLSFVVNIVEDKKLLGNTIALNSVMFNGARLVGPSIAGYLVSAFGEGYCFLINGFCHIAVLIALFKIKIDEVKSTVDNSGVFQNIREGVYYVYHRKDILYFVINVMIFTLFGFNYVVLLPVIARDVLGGDAKTLGFLMSAIGCGALSGALTLSSRKSPKGLSKQIVNFGFIACISFIFLALSTNVYITAFFAMCCGYCMMLQMAGANVVIQHLVDDEMRGRVMSLYSLAFMGFMPIGSLIAGSLSHIKFIGVKYTLIISAIILLVAGFLLRKRNINTI